MDKDSAHSGCEVVFYQLSSKFVDNEREIPDESSEVLYYSLAIGHHTGIIDCFSEKFRCPYEAYLEVIEALPKEGKARFKLEGILRYGEIQVDKIHASFLLEAIKQLDSEKQGNLSKEAQDWLRCFSESLESIKSSPAVYLMAKAINGDGTFSLPSPSV